MAEYVHNIRADAKDMSAAELQTLATDTYGPLRNRSVAHPFLLAAFHSRFIGEQYLSASLPFFVPFSMNVR